VENFMIGYTTVGTNNFERSAQFYDALLGELGAKRAMQSDKFVMWMVQPGKPYFAIAKPFNGEPATIGNGTMIALVADKPATVDRMYQKALALGASDEGAPGDRGGGFYAAYFRDPEGNKLNFFCMGG
jgi:catechol 2,3-dioxygenase-like lactoylglutathione lyase family enzyme